MAVTHRGALLVVSLGLVTIGALGCAAEDAQPGTRIPDVTSGGGPEPGGDLVWKQGFGQVAVDSTQLVRDLAVVRDEGYLFSVVDFDNALELPNVAGSPLLTKGSRDIALVKMSVVEGNAVWAKHFGDSAEQFRTTVAVDKVGNVALAGGWDGALDVDGKTSPVVGGLIDAYVVKLDASGLGQWAYRAGDADVQYATDVAFDPDGNVIVVGVAKGNVDFGDGVVTAPSAGTDIFVLKLDPGGQHLWHQRVGRAGSEDWRNPSVAVAVMPSGDIVLTGTLSGTLTFSGCALPTYGGTDAFVARLAPDGTCVFGKTFGPADDQAAHGVAIGPGEEIYVTGDFQVGLDLGGGTLLEGRGGSDLFVLALDGAGKHLWSQRFGSVGHQVGRSITVSPSGDVVVGGEFRGALEFYGEDAIISAQSGSGPSDVFVLKLDAEGRVLWGKGFGGDEWQGATTVLCDSKDQVLVGGWFERDLPLSSGETLTNSSMNGTDGFVFALSP
ncbi:hypothetical protein [Polyangium spumosum]|uniref:PQQ-binding-like beta-propeller repeat protein n=1 Tax=Polyangium spumosum TaxID=889282 RepID=A0A6N7PQ97_9BACT|nr:hypothetical protein [Polyangium spumosum]MRG94153.1 hypothetical protein [Polyangium spumosum]